MIYAKTKHYEKCMDNSDMNKWMRGVLDVVVPLKLYIAISYNSSWPWKIVYYTDEIQFTIKVDGT